MQDDTTQPPTPEPARSRPSTSDAATWHDATELRIATDRSGALCVSGDVDLAAAPRLTAELRRHVATGTAAALDLSGVTFIDSAGVAAIVRGLGAGRAERGVTLRGASCPVRRVLELSGVTQLFAPS